MHISEESNTQQLAVQYVGERYNHVCVYDMNVNNVKLCIYIPPSLNFYQWNDFGESTTEKRSIL